MTDTEEKIRETPEKFKVTHGACSLCNPDWKVGDVVKGFCGHHFTIKVGVTKPPDGACIVCVEMSLIHNKQVHGDV